MRNLHISVAILSLWALLGVWWVLLPSEEAPAKAGLYLPEEAATD
jgi:hypothetical protein